MTADTLLAEFMMRCFSSTNGRSRRQATMRRDFYRCFRITGDWKPLRSYCIPLNMTVTIHFAMYRRDSFKRSPCHPPPSRKTKSAGLKPGTYITRSIRKLSHFLPLCFQKLAHTRGWVGILSRQHSLSDFSAQFSPNSFRCFSYEKSHESREHASCKYFACHSYRSTFC